MTLRPRKTKQKRFPEIKSDDGQILRHCPSCETNFPATLEYFYAHKKGMYGLSFTCRPCVSKQGREWRENNKSKKAKRDKLYAERNKEKVAAYQKAYREENRQKAHEYILRYNKSRTRSDPEYRLIRVFRAQLARMIKGVPGKTRHLPFTMSELKQHIERQFTKGMSWENYGEWHVDHITPVSSFTFDYIGGPEFLACWGLPNLRPLWAKENISKKAKRTHLI